MKKTIYSFFIWVSIFYVGCCNGLTLQRVILSTDDNPNYIQFWPIVAKAWKEVVGLQPTLALIAAPHVQVDETLGDVIRFEPIPGISTALQAQVIRLLLPAYFPHEGCIISDIDMIPLSKGYFVDTVQQVPEDGFVVYRDRAYVGPRFPMCYIAAKGKVFQEVFNLPSVEKIAQKIILWSKLQLGWDTDELLLYKYLTLWDKSSTHCTKLGHSVFSHQRIDRTNWHWDPALLEKGFYIDAHCPRPYESCGDELDLIVDYACS